MKQLSGMVDDLIVPHDSAVGIPNGADFMWQTSDLEGLHDEVNIDTDGLLTLRPKHGGLKLTGYDSSGVQNAQALANGTYCADDLNLYGSDVNGFWQELSLKVVNNQVVRVKSYEDILYEAPNPAPVIQKGRVPTVTITGLDPNFNQWLKDNIQEIFDRHSLQGVIQTEELVAAPHVFANLVEAENAIDEGDNGGNGFIDHRGDYVVVDGKYSVRALSAISYLAREAVRATETPKSKPTGILADFEGT